MGLNASKTIDVESWLEGTPGDILLATNNSDKHLNLYVTANYRVAESKCASITLSPEKARALRDALIEFYPLETPKPKAVYSVGDKSSFGSVHPQWEACYPIIKTYRREAVDTVGYARSMREAEAMAAALNTTRE